MRRLRRVPVPPHSKFGTNHRHLRLGTRSTIQPEPHITAPVTWLRVAPKPALGATESHGSTVPSNNRVI